MKAIGYLLLTAGFLAGAYASVAKVETVDWMFYGVCALLMLFGVVALFTARSAEREGGSGQQEADILKLQSSLSSLLTKVLAFEERKGDEEQLDVYKRIDDELLGDIDAFVEARESMIPRFGMQVYADVMSPFANAERLLNRAWSASADGYVDEVRLCIGSARVELEKASSLLASQSLGKA